jgi:hypothetical protein
MSLNLHFGIVKNYDPERGFGFISTKIFSEPSKEIFFHISNVKKTSDYIYEKLLGYYFNHKICFWFKTELTKKGEQLNCIVNAKEVFKINKINSDLLKESVRLMWINIDDSPPFWAHEITVGLFGNDGLLELKNKRDYLISKREIDLRLKKMAADKQKLKEAEDKPSKEKIAEQLKNKRDKEEISNKNSEENELIKENIRDQEFELLVDEINSKGFSRSAEVSNYIIRNKLGNKYQNISGVLIMSNSKDTWKFNGGFPPDIYAKLCERLNLSNNGSDSKVVGFTSFKDLSRKKY